MFCARVKFERNCRRVIDIGSGIARQTLQFAIHGASVTFVDIVKDNLEVIRRVARSKGVHERVCSHRFVKASPSIMFLFCLSAGQNNLHRIYCGHGTRS
jgi:ubiquinone/menaquinone biosynthesis C-methylase UbiE